MGKARKRSHGHGTVFVRPNGRSTAQITSDGQRRSIGTFATREAAERALAKSLVEGPPAALVVTFGELSANPSPVGTLPRSGRAHILCGCRADRRSRPG